jgi:hypothetical protein
MVKVAFPACATDLTFWSLWQDMFKSTGVIGGNKIYQIVADYIRPVAAKGAEILFVLCLRKFLSGNSRL